MKRRNAVIVKKELATVNKQEQELEQLLYREKAELDKVRATILLDMQPSSRERGDLENS